MADAQIRSLARRLAALERARLQSKQPNLGFSTIDGGALQAVDDDGAQTLIIGRQFDETNGAVTVTGPTPPQPTPALVTPALGALRIYWDGTYAGGEVTPLDFTRVLVYATPLASFTAADPLDQTIIVGQITSATGGEVTASLDPDVEYAVYLVTWTAPGKYSAASDVATGIPTAPAAGGGAATDGNPPASSPVPTLTPGIGMLFARWEPVVNADTVTYDLHVSPTTPVAADATTLVGSVAGTFATVKALADGSPLVAGTDYYARVVARDADGAAAASAESAPVAPALVNSEDLAVNSVYAANIVAGEITGDKFAATAIDGMEITGATVRTAVSGRRVVMDQQGFRLEGSDERTLVNLPSDPNMPARFEGDAHIHNLTVDEFTTLQQSELAEAATFTMQSSVRPPSNAPSIEPNVYYAQQFEAALPWSEKTGIAVDRYGANEPTTAWTLAMYGSGTLGVESYDLLTGDEGLRMDYIDGLRGPVKYYTLTYSRNATTGTGYLHVLYYDSYIGDWFIRTMDTNGAGTTLSDIKVPINLMSSIIRWPAMAWDEVTDEIIIAQANDFTDYLRFRRLSAPDLRAGTVTNLGYADSTITYDWHLSYFGVGDFDFGSKRYVVGARSGQEEFNVFTRTGLHQPEESWPTGVTNRKVGGYWDGTYFWGVNDTGLRRRYQGHASTWLGDLQRDVQIGYTWFRSSDSAETTISPVATVTMNKRSRIKFTTLPIPQGGPDNLRLYGRVKPAAGTVETTADGNKYAFNGTVNFTTGYINSLAVTPGADPTDNTFGTGIPSKFQSAGLRADGKPKIELDGSGAARMDGLIPPGSVMMFATATAPTGWLHCDGSAVSRTTYKDLFNAIGTTYGAGDGSTTFNLPDMRSRFARQGTPGVMGGEDWNYLTVGQLPAHVHDIAHTHTIIARESGPGPQSNRVAQGGGTGTINSSNTSVNGTGPTDSGPTGSNNAVDNRPAFTQFSFIIKW